MSLETWLLFVLISIVPVISPGPGVFLTTKNALKYGAGPTLFSAFGNALGLVLLGFGVSFGISAAINAAGWIGTAIQIAGASYLIYLGIKIWRDKSLGQFDTRDASAPTLAFTRLFEGLFISITNPKAIAVLAAIIPPFLSEGGSGSTMLAEATILSLTYGVMCMGNHLAVIAFARKLEGLFKNVRYFAMLRAVLSACFVGAGGTLALN